MKKGKEERNEGTRKEERREEKGRKKESKASNKERKKEERNQRMKAVFFTNLAVTSSATDADVSKTKVVYRRKMNNHLEGNVQYPDVDRFEVKETKTAVLKPTD